MGKRLSVTVIFFLVSFTLSLARVPANLPSDDVIKREVQHPLPESDSTAATTTTTTRTIHLPSETSSDESSRVDSTNGAAAVATVPLQFVSFRPVNRRFFTHTLRGKFPLRRCHGRLRRNSNQLRQRFEISYGDDMILSAAVKKDPELMNYYHGGEEQIPLRWSRLHNRHQNPFVRQTEMPYGDDMFVSASVNKDSSSSPRNLHRREAHIPSKWVTLQHLHHHHLHHDDDELEGIPMKQESHHHDHHDHDSDDEDEHELEGKPMKRLKKNKKYGKVEVEETKSSMKHENHHHHRHDEDELTKPEKPRKHGGFLKRFRKFLKQFDF